MRDLTEVIPCLDAHGTAPAVVDEEGRVHTWGEIADRVRRRARDLMVGDVVLLHEGDAFSRVVDLLACEHAEALAVVVLPRVPAPVASAHARRIERAVAARAASHDDVRGLSVAVLTSGSTRAPRAAVLDGDALLSSARSANAHIAFHEGHRWLLSLSLAHVGGLGVLARARLDGGALAIHPAGRDLAVALSAARATHVSLVAAQLVDLVDASRRAKQLDACENLEVALVGGGPVPDALIARSAHLPVVQTWGMTETCAQVATGVVGQASTCGPPLAGRTVRVGESGELLVKGGAFARFIVDDESMAPLPFDEAGFFHTRDRGALTAEGHVVVHGRLDTVFISGGENVQPELIEGVLGLHPAVRRALVVPVPHPRFGERPFAFVDVGSQTLDEGALRVHLSERLARHELPDHFAPWPPGEADGKPSRPHFAARARALVDERSG